MSQVLIVDDEISIRTSLGIFLKKDGYQVDLACDAVQASAMIDEKEYDVILTDVIMPKMTGIELLNKVRQQSSTIQVIIMTGEPTLETAVHAVQLGANNYLSKPIDKSMLLNTVRQAVQIKQLSDQKKLMEIQQANYLKDLEKMVQIQTKELQESMQSIVLLLSTVIESKDPYTAGHQRRVGNLSAEIARKMGYNGRIVNNLRIVGYMHDIGKMAIPGEIINKPGRLNGFEMGLIRMHSEQGYVMLSQVKLPDNIADIVYQHHERINGSGYPRGLKEREILEEACILAVADVVEAMMSHRPYRAALGLDLALDEIEKNRGILYRNEVVDACLSLFRDDHYDLDDQAHQVNFTVTAKS